MDHVERPFLDVAIIGGGPAGISAGLELSKSSDLKIVLFESESELGGIPRSCHIFFGMRDRKRLYTGLRYARKLDRKIRRTSVAIHTQTTVLSIEPGEPGQLHRIVAASKEGLDSYDCRFVILSTGCFEASRQARLIPGTRPSGIFTTGALQQIVNLGHNGPGKRALIIGSEHVALSSVLTLKKAGIAIAGLVEENERLQTYQIPAKALSLFFRFPIHQGTYVKAILGRRRVEAVELMRQKDQKLFQVECDTVVVSGKFRPDSVLIDNTPIERDSSTLGPYVDGQLMTSVPNIFAAGNVLRGADMHDLCALEGKKAAQNIVIRLESDESGPREGISLRAEPPIRYVVPQRIDPDETRFRGSTRLRPGYCIQVERTLVNPVLEAWSGDEKIWAGPFRRLIANNRVRLPVWKFAWERVDRKKGVCLKLQDKAA